MFQFSFLFVCVLIRPLEIHPNNNNNHNNHNNITLSQLIYGNSAAKIDRPSIGPPSDFETVLQPRVVL